MMTLVYILWAIINVALWVYFFYILYHSILTIKEKLGWGAVALLFFGLQCNTNNNQTETKTDSWVKDKKNNSITGNKAVLDKIIEVEKNWLLTKSLHVSYLRDYDTKENSILSAYTSIDGWQVATRSTLDILSISPNEKGDISFYTLQEETKWYLLGMQIFTNAKPYNGLINLNK